MNIETFFFFFLPQTGYFNMLDLCGALKVFGQKKFSKNVLYSKCLLENKIKIQTVWDTAEQTSKR